MSFTDEKIRLGHLFDFDRAVVAWLESSHVPELDFMPPPQGVLHEQEKQDE